MTTRNLARVSALLSLIALGLAPMGPGTARAASARSSGGRSAVSWNGGEQHARPHQMNGWKPYHSAHADYTVAYPASWSVTERVGTNGWLRTTFSPPNGAAGIMITVRPHEIGSDLPNARCQRIQVGGLVGSSCFNTMSFTRSTTFTARGKTYSISTSVRPARRADLKVYQRMVQSFRLV